MLRKVGLSNHALTDLSTDSEPSQFLHSYSSEGDLTIMMMLLSIVPCIGCHSIFRSDEQLP